MCYLVIDLVFLLHLRMTLRHAPGSLLVQGMYPPCSASWIPKDGHQVAPSAPHHSLGHAQAQGCWALVNCWPQERGKAPRAACCHQSVALPSFLMLATLLRDITL